MTQTMLGSHALDSTESALDFLDEHVDDDLFNSFPVLCVRVLHVCAHWCATLDCLGSNLHMLWQISLRVRSCIRNLKRDLTNLFLLA